MELIRRMLSSVAGASDTVREVRVGPFVTAVLLAGDRSGRFAGIPRCGISSTLAGHLPGQTPSVREVGRLERLGAARLAEFLLSDNRLEASIGMATLNALADLPEDASLDSSALQQTMSRARGSRVGVVGHFPFVSRIREVADEVLVFELRPGQGDLPAERAAELLPGCDPALITGTVLVNGTYEELFRQRGDGYTVLLGPSTPPCPELFEMGIDLLAGSLVVDPHTVLRMASQGAAYKHLDGVRKWVMHVR